MSETPDFMQIFSVFQKITFTDSGYRLWDNMKYILKQEIIVDDIILRNSGCSTITEYLHNIDTGKNPGGG